MEKRQNIRIQQLVEMLSPTRFMPRNQKGDLLCLLTIHTAILQNLGNDLGAVLRMGVFIIIVGIVFRRTYLPVRNRPLNIMAESRYLECPVSFRFRVSKAIQGY